MTSEVFLHRVEFRLKKRWLENPVRKNHMHVQKKLARVSLFPLKPV